MFLRESQFPNFHLSQVGPDAALLIFNLMFSPSLHPIFCADIAALLWLSHHGAISI